MTTYSSLSGFQTLVNETLLPCYLPQSAGWPGSWAISAPPSSPGVTGLDYYAALTSYIYLCGWACTLWQVRQQRVGVGALLPPSWVLSSLNSACEAQQQALFHTELIILLRHSHICFAVFLLNPGPHDTRQVPLSYIPSPALHFHLLIVENGFYWPAWCREQVPGQLGIMFYSLCVGLST